MDLKSAAPINSSEDNKKKAKKSAFSENQMGQPWMGNTAYRVNHVDFSAGGVYHERRPNYPFYSLPFKGDSSYQNTYINDKLAEDTEYEKNLKKDMKVRMRKG